MLMLEFTRTRTSSHRITRGLQKSDFWIFGIQNMNFVVVVLEEIGEIFIEMYF